MKGRSGNGPSTLHPVPAPPQRASAALDDLDDREIAPREMRRPMLCPTTPAPPPDGPLSPFLQPKSKREPEADTDGHHWQAARFRDSSGCRHYRGLRRGIGHGGRPVEVHIDRESEPIGRIGRQSRDRPGKIGEHAECKSAALRPVRRVERQDRKRFPGERPGLSRRVAPSPHAALLLASLPHGLAGRGFWLHPSEFPRRERCAGFYPNSWTGHVRRASTPMRFCR
jgi:hypothetical protein